MTIPTTVLLLWQLLTIAAAMGQVGAANSTEIVGYQPSPSNRGTVDILKSCLVALFASVWTILHLNVPARHDGTWVTFRRKLKWMVFMIFAPELLCAHAALDLISARSSVKRLVDAGYGNWSMTHGFFANQGGFVLEYNCRGEIKKRLPLLWPQLAIIVEDSSYGITVPRIDVEDINDRNKADQVTKIFACLQSLWLVIGVIIRGIKGLEISQLEIMTISYIFMAVIIYGLWWYKPCDVGIPFVIHGFDGEIPLDLVAKLRAMESAMWQDQVDKQRIVNMGIPQIVLRDLEKKIGFQIPRGEVSMQILMFYGFGIVFILLHFGAWNFYYPTSIELWLWRGCSLAALVTLVILSLVSFFYMHDPDQPGLRELTTRVGLWTMAIYTTARAYFVIEAFISLRGAPRSLYEISSWFDIIPHV